MKLLSYILLSLCFCVSFYPTKVASKAITSTIKQQCNESWVSWVAIPPNDQDHFFQRFKVSYFFYFGMSILVFRVFTIFTFFYLFLYNFIPNWDG